MNFGVRNNKDIIIMKRKIIKWGIISVILVILIVGSYELYLWNMPHRDVQSSPVDFEVSAHEIVEEYLNNPEEANDKYLSEDGDSKILLVEGSVASIETDMNNQKVVLLKEENDKAGVSCTFMENTNSHLENVKAGDMIRVKGVIRSGAGYDEDLELYEDVIMEKCDIK